MRDEIKIKGIFDCELVRGGKVIDRWRSENLVTNEGLNALLGIMFSDDTQITDWYVVLSETNTTPAGTMTYATPSFTESTTEYDETTRPLWNEGGVSSQSIDNSSNKASFTFNSSTTIYGAGLVGGGTGASTKGDTAGGGVLYNFSLFSSSKSVVNTDVLNVTVTLTISAA